MPARRVFGCSVPALRVNLLVQLVATAALAGVASADSGGAVCAETGIGRVAVSENGLRLEEGIAQPLRAGDILIQLNSHRLQTCSDLTQALDEARRNQLALLLLIRRDGKTDVALLEWPVVAAAAQATPQASTVAPTRVPSAAPTAMPTVVPRPASPADVDAVRTLHGALMAFGRDVQARQPLPMAQPWVQRIEKLRQDYAKQAGTAGVGALEPVLAYYETIAQILIYKENATRERRDLRARAEVVLEYHRGSSVEAWLQRYAFLQPSVIREPEAVHFIAEGERNGLWAPDRAVSLLLEQALSEGGGWQPSKP